MKSIDRLYQYLDFKGIKPTNFEREMGFSSGYLSGQKKRKSDFGESVLRKIILFCPDLDEIWFLTGKGNMLKCDAEIGVNSSKDEPAAALVDVGSQSIENVIIRLQADALSKSERIIELMDQVNVLKEEIGRLKLSKEM